MKIIQQQTSKAFLQKAGFLPNIVELLCYSNIPLKMLIPNLFTELKSVKYLVIWSFKKKNLKVPQEPSKSSAINLKDSCIYRVQVNVAAA